MPVLDEASYLSKRAGSTEKNTSGDPKSTASGDSKITSSVKVPNGVAKPPTTAAMPNLIDFSIDDAPVPPTSTTASEPPNFMMDLIDINLPSSTPSGSTLSFFLSRFDVILFHQETFVHANLSSFLVCLGGEPAPVINRNIIDDLLSIGTSPVENGLPSSSSFPTITKS